MDRSNIEETSYEAQRLARRERMKEEKRRQAAARAMLKKLLPLVITGLIAIVVLIGAIVWGVRSLVDRHEVRLSRRSFSRRRLLKSHRSPNPK